MICAPILRFFANGIVTVDSVKLYQVGTIIQHFGVPLQYFSSLHILTLSIRLLKTGINLLIAVVLPVGLVVALKPKGYSPFSSPTLLH
jgi:hypothetical protein